MKLLMQFFIVTIFSSPYFSGNNSLIYWSAERKLSWGDFKARPDRNSTNAAMTATDIRFDFTYNTRDGFKFHITCRFDKNSSWGRVKTDYILSHEQGHFDIAEIYARKLNKALNAFIPGKGDPTPDVNKIYENVMRELTVAQAQYDKETNFSINKGEQSRWLLKINDDLRSNEANADYR